MSERFNVIFLDFDGVLNNTPWLAQSGVDETEVSQLDPRCCELLQNLCSETNTRIVISSSWRLLHPLVDLRGFLRRRGVTVPVLGKTPATGKERGHDIQMWLDAASDIYGTIEGVAILDDDCDMVHLTPWLVRTYRDRGLTPWECDKVKEILSSRHLPAMKART